MRILLALLLLGACHAVERPVPSRSAEVRITVEDTAEALTSVVASVEAAGGQVVESQMWREDGQLRASVILRVPQHELMRTLAAIRDRATSVESENVALKTRSDSR